MKKTYSILASLFFMMLMAFSLSNLEAPAPIETDIVVPADMEVVDFTFEAQEDVQLDSLSGDYLIMYHNPIPEINVMPAPDKALRSEFAFEGYLRPHLNPFDRRLLQFSPVRSQELSPTPSNYV